MSILQDDYKYDFAFSFSGNERNVVKEIYNAFLGKDYTIFYDEKYTVEMLGKPGCEFLEQIYLRDAKYVVCFLSNSYVEKFWTNIEFAAIKKRIMQNCVNRYFLILITLDDIKLEESIFFDTFYYQYENLKTTVKVLEKKIQETINQERKLFNTLNCINFVSNVVCRQLKNSNLFENVELKESTIIIKTQRTDLSYKFSPDYIGDFHCFLVYESAEKYNPFYLNLPLLFITWNTELKFTIYSCNELVRNSKENMSIVKLCNKIFEYIQNSIGREIW